MRRYCAPCAFLFSPKSYICPVVTLIQHLTPYTHDTMLRLQRIGLLPRILLALLLGIGLGGFVPEGFVRLFLTFNGLFARFLDFIIPLIILALVAEAISSIGKQAGRMLLLTVALAYGSTIFAGYLAYFTGISLFPQLVEHASATPLAEVGEGLKPFFTLELKPVMDVMTALVLAFILGLAAAHMHLPALRGLIVDLKELVSRVIETVLIPLLPLYIFGIFLDMAHSGQVLGVLLVFVKIIGVIFALHILLLLLQYGAAGLVTRRNPLRLLLRMTPAYFTALGTSSSAATIPVTLEQTKRNGVREGIAAFVIPLCATIHLSGSMLKIVSCALALILISGGAYDLAHFTHFILLLGITMVAAPGVPGGAIMAALAVLASVLGFSPEQQALMISLYITMDSFGTACNVTGDGAIALVIDRCVELPECGDAAA